jgi:hypothetical protein
MYTGYILIFGFQTTLDIVSQIFDGKENEIEEENYYKYDFLEDINDIMIEKGYKFIELIYKNCCYYDKDQVFLGVHIGSTKFVYRSAVEEYQTFEDYDNEKRKQLDNIKKMYDENEEEILKEFNNFSKQFNLDELQRFPKFYTFANDCENCT